jgi:hypothetical protein
MNRVELIGIVSKAPWEYLKNVTMFEVETSTLDHVTTHNLLSPKRFEDITNTLEEGDTVHITDRLMHEISVGKQAQDNLDIINRDGFVLEHNVDHSRSTN